MLLCDWFSAQLVRGDLLTSPLTGRHLEESWMWKTAHPTVRTPQIVGSACAQLCRQGGDSGLSAALSFPVLSVPSWHTESQGN